MKVNSSKIICNPDDTKELRGILGATTVTFYQVTSKARLLNNTPLVQGISPLPEHKILIFPRCKQSDRYFVSTSVTSCFITRLAEMSAALAAVAFSFMATL